MKLGCEIIVNRKELIRCKEATSLYDVAIIKLRSQGVKYDDVKCVSQSQIDAWNFKFVFHLKKEIKENG